MEIKDIAIWLLIFIIGSLVVNFIVNPSGSNSIKSEISKIYNSIGGKITESTKTYNDDFCETEIIPENITFLFDYGIGNWGQIVSNWKNGKPIGQQYLSVTRGDPNYMEMTIKTGIKCDIGSKQGENINYLYCERMVYSDIPITEEGKILEEVKYDIEFVLDSKILSEGTYVVTEFMHTSKKPTSTYAVVDYNCYKSK